MALAETAGAGKLFSFRRKSTVPRFDAGAGAASVRVRLPRDSHRWVPQPHLPPRLASRSGSARQLVSDCLIRENAVPERVYRDHHWCCAGGWPPLPPSSSAPELLPHSASLHSPFRVAPSSDTAIAAGPGSVGWSCRPWAQPAIVGTVLGPPAGTDAFRPADK